MASAHRLVLAAALLTSACGESEPDGPTLTYLRDGRPVLPFPNDLLTEPGDTPTGLRVALRPRGENLGDVDEALYLLGEDFIEATAKLDGWSTLAAAFMPLRPPATEASMANNIALYDLDDGTRVAARVERLDGETDYGRYVVYASARPIRPLQPKHRHAIVALSGLESEEEGAYVPTANFRAYLESAAGTSALRGLEAALEADGHTLEDVLIADTYTTQSVAEESDVLTAAMRAEARPQLILDADGDGGPDLYFDPREDPRGNVPNDREYPNIQALIRARFSLPNFRLDVDGEMQTDHVSAELQGVEDVELIVLLPNGAGPFPIVVYHHGIGADKELVFDYADDLCAQGVAVIAMDGPIHGYRTDRPGNAATRFLNITRPDLIVDNFRQGETDMVYFIRVVDALSEADLLEDGSRPLDPTRLLLLGESLGAMIGSAAIALEPRFEGAVLMVGGGTLLEFFDRFLSGFEFDGFPTTLFTHLAQMSLDRGDPTNFANRIADKQILLVQAMDDTVIPAGATQSLALALDLPQVGTIHARLEGVEAVEPPHAARGWTQFSEADHGLFHASERNSYALARAQVFHFIRTWAETGTGEIR